MSSSGKKEYNVTNSLDTLRNLVEQSLVGIYIYQDGFLPYLNPKAAGIFGYTQEESSSIPLSKLIAEDDYPLVTETIRNIMEGKTKDAHLVIRGKRKDGSIIELEAQGARTEFNGRPAIAGTFLDITGRNTMEAEAQKAQKLESLSAFASGLALEYNNILTALIGNLALAKMYAKPGYEVYDVLTEAEKASLRAKDLTSQLMSFAKGGILVRKKIFFQELIRAMISRALDDKPVTCEMSVPGDLWPVMVDESQIGQAIISILRYAAQAGPQGGSIKISAANMRIAPSSAVPLREGRYVVCTIEDQGKGIADDTLKALFDPFHAGEKKGATLGLASSFAVVRKHDGYITAESLPGAGTTFRMYIPAAEERAPSAPGTSSAPPRRGKILVMDDEEIVRIVASRLIQQCGFETELARDGEEMLMLYRRALESGSPFQAVILDLIIQDGMGGQEAMKRLLAFDPHAKVIVSSGYSHDPLMANFSVYGFTGYLPKPYKLEELRRVLAEVISAP